MALPTDIANLWAWFRASSFALADGDTCGSWTDASGNGRHLSTVGGTPKYRAGQVGGYPAVYYDGSSHHSANLGWLSSLATHTKFLVFSPESPGGGSGIIGSDGGSSSEAFAHDTANVIARANQFNLAPYTVSQPGGLDAWHYAYSRQVYQSLLTLSVNGATESTTPMNSNHRGNFPTTEVGQVATDGGSLWKGYVAEWFVFNASLAADDLQLMVDYLQAKYFSVVPTQNDQMRDVISRRLWLRRRSPTLLEVSAPLWMLDADILDRIALEHQAGPDPSGAGWRAKKWQRHAFSIQRIDVDPSAKVVHLQLLDRRPLDILLLDTARTDKPALGVDTTRKNGVAQILQGNAIGFVRTGEVWVPNPSDDTSAIQVESNQQAFTTLGEYLEEQRTNAITRSSFIDGTTGLTLAGTGTNGSAIATDDDEQFFNPEVGAPSLKYTAGNPHSADLKCTFPATASFGSGVNVRLSIDHKTDTGEPLHYTFTRSADGWYWNDSTGAFQSGAVQNSLGTQSSRSTSDRYVSKKIPIGGSASTLTLAVLLPSGGTASRISHLYHAQIEQGSFATSRIVSQGGVAQQRGATEHTLEVSTTAKCYNPDLGTFFCEFVPDWSSADLDSSEDRYLYWMETNGGADHDALYYDASAGAFVFERKVGGSTYQATKTATVTRGTKVKLAARWTGSEGELDLDPYTISVFVDGVKGTDDVAAAPTFTSPETMHRGHDVSTANHANGAIGELRVFPIAYTDEEVAALP